MSWNPNSQPIDYFTLAGQKSPGIAELENGGDLLRELKERRGFGVSGAFAVFSRVPLVNFTFKIRLVTPEHWAAWHVWKSIVYKLPEKRIGALDFWHPLLEDHGVKSVIVQSISTPKREGEDGGWAVLIGFKEQRAPKLTLSTPQASQSTPQDPYDAAIDEERRRGEINEARLAEGARP